MGLAILGAGIFVTEAYIPALAALGHHAPPLKAIYSRSLKSAADVAAALMLPSPPALYHDAEQTANLDALLARDDISSVIVALPITLQPSVILKVLAAGKHVLSEKPIGKDVQTGLDLIATYATEYKPKGLIWRVAENFEAEPGYRAAAQAIRAGHIGKVISFNARVVNYIDQDSKWYQTPWRTVPEYQGGFLLDGGVHTIAALRVMLPHALSHLSAISSLNKDYLAPHDTIHAIVKADTHLHGIVEMTFAHPTQSRPKNDMFVITGDKGWLSVNQISSPDSAAPILRVSIRTLGDDKELIIDEPSRGVQVELESFFKKVNGQETLDIGDPFEALKDVAFIQAALTSGGNLVDLDALVTPK